MRLRLSEGDVRPEYLSVVDSSGDDVRAVAVDVQQDARAFEGFRYRCYTAGLQSLLSVHVWTSCTPRFNSYLHKPRITSLLIPKQRSPHITMQPIRPNHETARILSAVRELHRHTLPILTLTLHHILNLTPPMDRNTVPRGDVDDKFVQRGAAH